MLDELVGLVEMLRSLIRHLVPQGKLERLIDGERWEVDVICHIVSGCF